MRAQAKFRSVGLANEDRSGIAQALDHKAIGGGYEVLENRRALSRANVLDRLQVFHCMGNAMQRTQVLAARQLVFEPAGAAEELTRLMGRDESVDSVI